MPAATVKAPKLELVDIDALEPNPANPNEGDIGAICDLIVHNGWFGQTLVQTRDGQPDRVFVGEHRWRALRLLQAQGGVVRENGSETTLDYAALQARAEALDLPALPPQGKCWVQRYAISDRLARRHMLADNRSQDLSSYDDQQLAAILRDIADEDGLVGTGFDDEALDELLRDLAADEAKNRPRASDEAPERPENPVTKLGDLIVLGEHRLLCGDSRDPSAVMGFLDGETVDLIWTDPPYGVAYQAMRGGKPIENDGDLETAGLTLAEALNLAGCQAAFVACSWRSLGVALQAMEKVGLDPKSCIVWDKGSRVQNLDRFAKQHEFLLYSGPFGGEPTVDVDVWLIPRDFDPNHPTPKPVELVARGLKGASEQGALVFDPFAGSGTTLMACEQEGRRARCIEIDPGYCDVIVARWEKHTGRAAERP